MLSMDRHPRRGTRPATTPTKNSCPNRSTCVNYIPPLSLSHHLCMYILSHALLSHPRAYSLFFLFCFVALGRFPPPPIYSTPSWYHHIGRDHRLIHDMYILTASVARLRSAQLQQIRIDNRFTTVCYLKARWAT